MKIIDTFHTELPNCPYEYLDRHIKHLGITVKITVEDRNTSLTAEEYAGKYKHHLGIYLSEFCLTSFSFRSPYVYGDALTNFAKDLLLCGKFSDYNKNAFLEFFKA